jgi:hypothetical protein
MLRRITACHLMVLLLLPGMSAAHSHAEVNAHDPSGVYRPPHFHLRFLISWPQGLADQVDSANEFSNEGYQARPLADHDADAIYLPDSNLSGGYSDPPVNPSAEADTSAMPDLAESLSVSARIHALSPTTPVPTIPCFLLSVSLLI